MRNFTVIAHIDHGKSTLCDRILELTGDIEKGKHDGVILDSMPLERERGITIKAKAVRISYKGKILNMVDTPGHVDFSYEVSRTLSSCEAAILVVDASQGVEAQTVANYESARKSGLKIIPVLNKIDMPNARPKEAEKEIRALLGEDTGDILRVSARTGEGVKELLEQIIRDVPPPQAQTGRTPSALIFDSVFDPFKGAIAYIRVTGGRLRVGDKVRFFAAESDYEIKELGFFGVSEMTSVKELKVGEIGYIICGMKDLSDIMIGDTITSSVRGVTQPLPGFRQPKQFVFAGLYPVENADYLKLKSALDKLSINDTSFTYTPEDSSSLGPGFRCGFLGVLHLEIIKSRLEEEYELSLVATRPQVEYIVDGKLIDNPVDFPDLGYSEVLEPYTLCTVITPAEYMGQIYELFEQRGGTYVDMSYINPDRVILKYELPLREMVEEFYGMLKSCSRGYASLDYSHIGNRPSELVKLKILVHGKQIDALSFIMPRESAIREARRILDKLKDLIPRHQFRVALQAEVGKNIVARQDIPALRKNVTAGLYGGDVTRKRKLLERQREGKKRMKQVGQVGIPTEAFIAVKTYGE